LSGKGAWHVFLRDRLKHASPNSAQGEAATAGALGVRLAGPASYFGKIHEKEWIGDDTRPVEPQDISRAVRLMYATSLATLALCVVVTIVVKSLPKAR
jgi:adenosylcobinamide-phosphate synthase